MSVRLGPDHMPARRRPPRNRCGRIIDRDGAWWTCRRLAGHNGRHARRMTWVERWLRLL